MNEEGSVAARGKGSAAGGAGGLSPAARDLPLTDETILRSLPPQLSTWITSSGNTAALETRWATQGLPTRNVLARGLAVTTAAMAPADPALLIRELTELRLVTKARDAAAEELALSNRAMAEALMAWPGDVAVASIREVARSATFFPALAEIIQICRERAAFRRNIHRCLTRAMKRLTDELN